MKFIELFKKLIGQTVVTSSKNVRSIEQLINNGEIKYRVIFTNITHYTVKNKKGNIIKEYDVKKDTPGIIMFNNSKLAESYAKSVCKAEEWHDEYHHSNGIVIYPNNYQSIKNYGVFKLKGQYVYDFSVDEFDKLYFRFYDNYISTYGYTNSLRLSYLFDDTIINHVISESHIDIEPNIIKSFDVITLESIPYDRIKASSKELEEMNKILKEFKTTQEKYTNLLERLSNEK